jgi:hypothetical protein
VVGPPNATNEWINRTSLPVIEPACLAASGSEEELREPRRLSCGPKVEVVEFVGGRLRWLRVRGGRAGVEDELRAARPRRGEERGG